MREDKSHKATHHASRFHGEESSAANNVFCIQINFFLSHNVQLCILYLTLVRNSVESRLCKGKLALHISSHWRLNSLQLRTQTAIKWSVGLSQAE